MSQIDTTTPTLFTTLRVRGPELTRKVELKDHNPNVHSWWCGEL